MHVLLWRGAVVVGHGLLPLAKICNPRVPRARVLIASAHCICPPRPPARRGREREVGGKCVHMCSAFHPYITVAWALMFLHQQRHQGPRYLYRLSLSINTVVQNQRRVLSGRTASLSSHIQPPYRQANPSIHLVPSELEALGLAASADRTVPSGMSIQWSGPPSSSQGFWQQLPEQLTQQLPPHRLNWRQGRHEVLLGVSGRKAGAPKQVKVAPGLLCTGN